MCCRFPPDRPGAPAGVASLLPLLGMTLLLSPGCQGTSTPTDRAEVAQEPREAPSDSTTWVVVEDVGKGSALERAGLQPGVLLFSWERLPNPPANPETARGELHSPFDWMWLEVEQAPRGTVLLVPLCQCT